jgi:hypothetical protein
MNRNQTSKMKTYVTIENPQTVKLGSVGDSSICHRCKYPGHHHHACHLARCKVCRMFGHDEKVCPHTKS